MKNSSNVTTLLIGMIIGLFGGFIVGAFLGKSVFQLASLLIHLMTKGSRSDEERMKFELLLQ